MKEYSYPVHEEKTLERRVDAKGRVLLEVQSEFGVVDVKEGRMISAAGLR